MAEEVIGLLFGVEGEGVNGTSGKLIVDSLTRIVNEINQGKSKVPKIEIQVDIADTASKALDDLKAKLNEIRKLASIKITQDTNNNSNTKNSNDSQDMQKQIEKYRELSAVIKKWSQEQKTAAKLAAEYYGVSRKSNGSLEGSTKGYEKRIAAINKTVKAMEQFKVTFNGDGTIVKPDPEQFQEIAQSIGITKEQYEMLLMQIQTGSQAAQVAIETSNRKNNQSWTATASKIRDEVQRMYATISKDPNAKKMADEIMKYSQSASGDVGELKNKYDQLRNSIHKSGADVETWGDKFKRTFAGKVRSALSAAIMAAFTKYLRQIYTNVVEINSAMTQLKIVTGATDSQMTKFFNSATASAKKLGASITDILKSIETFSRLGYGLEDATTLAEYAQMMSNVAGVTTDEATTGLTSIIKGYGLNVSQAEHVADVLVEVGQKYAVSASELMEAYSHAGAALSASNTSFEKSAGLIAAANAAVQDASTVGTALKTVSARIRGATTDLDNLGESTEDLAQGFSKYANEIKGLTGFNILVDGTTDQYKDLYDIFEGIAAQWDRLSDTQQARVAEILGGTRQLQVISSIMQNMSDATGAYADAMNSAGTATQANEEYMSSIQGKLGALKATFQDLSTSILSSNWITDIVDALKNILETLNSILSFGDGLVAKIGLVAASVFLLIAAHVKLNAAFTATKAKIVETIALEAALAKAQGVTATTTELLTAVLIKYSSTGLLGVITVIPRFILALKACITSMISAEAETLSFKAALDAFNVNPFVLAVTTVVAALAVVVAVVNNANAAWKKTYEDAKNAAEEQQKLIDKCDSEINALESLKNKLVDAHGNRQKLSSIYDELNKKVAVSSDLLKGEEIAYQAVTAQIEDQIAAMQKLREESLVDKISNERTAFNIQKGKRYNGVGWDWAVADSSGDIMRALMRGESSLASLNDKDLEWALLQALYDPSTDSDLINYDFFYNRLTSEQQKTVLEAYGFTVDSWKEYWDSQVATAKNVFADIINNSSGYFDSSFMESVVDRFIRGGYNLDETQRVLFNLTKSGGELNQEINVYYEALAEGSDKTTALYENVMNIFDELIEKYPELTKQFNALISSIRSPNSDSKPLGITVALKSVLEMLDEVQPGFDGLTKAMSSVTSEGYLTADALSALLKLEQDNALAGLALEDILIQDANGYRLVEGAIESYVKALIAKNTIEEGTIYATQKDKDNAISNLKALQTVLATLVRTQDESVDASKARRDELEKEQDAYKDQLDKFEELIDLRKELLKTYQEELDYQRELEKRQKNVSTLQTKLAIARLDTSAAGQARVRELEAQLKEAQEDLDDFTLEHAIDVLTNQLDSSYAEWKAIIQSKLDEITNLLAQLDTSTTVNVDTSWAQDMLKQVEQAIKDANEKDVENTVFSDSISERSIKSYQDYLDTMYAFYMGKLPSTSGRWTSYQDAQSAGHGNIMTKEDYDGSRDSADVFDSSGNRITADDILPPGKSSSVEPPQSKTIATKLSYTTPLYGATQTVSIDKYNSTTKEDSDGNTYFPYRDGQWAKLDEGYWIRTTAGGYAVNFRSSKPLYSLYKSYHTGGLVGGISTLSSSEEFAKLLKGEYVTTPAQMKRFMEETLPQIANYPATNGSNEFNAPLVEITCESVTTESLPELKHIINEAVNEIKKELDSGMSRVGFKRSITKRLV
nr:MAG TPA: minor tail protein [Caudoviricetes sp.]